VTVLYAGLITWLLTKIVVESELVRPIREWADWRRRGAQRAYVDTFAGLTMTRYTDTRKSAAWRHVCYLLNCHLCTGVWVGLGTALLIPGPFESAVSYPVAVVLAGLTYKAIGHLVLVIEGTLTS
jgi:amino acid permease